MSRSRIASVAVLGGMALVFAATPALGAGTTYSVGPIADISASCSGQNAEVEQAADAKLGYVYETWMGCRGIAFAPLDRRRPDLRHADLGARLGRLERQRLG